MCLLIVGFLTAAGPYMKLKGTIFPKKNFDLFKQETRQIDIYKKSNQVAYASQFAESNIIKAFGKLGQNIGETLMWFFVPAILIGMHTRFKMRKWHEPETFFLISLVVLNVLLMIFLYDKYGYMSYRHTLVLLILLVYYAPVGLQKSAIWFRHIFSGNANSISVAQRNEKLWFLILFFVGFFICVPKLLKPIRIEKQGNRAIAKWLETNTNSTDIIAVPDIRITFYAQRKAVVYENENIPSDAIVVKILKNPKDKAVLAELSDKVLYEYIDKREKSIDMVIYKKQ